MSTQSFSDWFNHQLGRRSWDRAEFHRRTGVARSTVYAWSTGTRVPDPPAVDVIADVFGLDVDTVLTIAGHRPSVDEIAPDDPRAEIIAKVKRVQWREDWLASINAQLDIFIADGKRKGKSL